MSPTAPRAAGAFDPVAAAFSLGQEAYRSGLLQLINTRRLLAGRAPAAWPAVGATPHEVVWREGGASLLRYRRDHVADAPGLPLLLVCSLINRPYVLDLLPGRSVVAGLVGAGFDVWLLDWGHPVPEDAERSLAAYALERLPRVAAAVLAGAGSDRLHILGYCMGGTFALMAIAAGLVPAASLIALATPVDMHDRGLLSTWCRAPGFAPEELRKIYGNLPPHVLAPAFKLLDPVGLGAKMVHLGRKIDDDDFVRFFLAMESWLEDSVAFPGRAFAEWTTAYRTNALASGTLLLDGTRIDLRRVTCPLLNIVADGDYITPPESSLALAGLTRTIAYEEIRMSGGHIGLSTGGAAHRTLWPRVAAWMRSHEMAGSAAPTTKASAARAARPTRAKAAKRPKPTPVKPTRRQAAQPAKAKPKAAKPPAKHRARERRR